MKKSLLDGSVGAHWSNYRKGKPWAGERVNYTHIFPDKRGEQQAWAYPLQELPEFERWLRAVYTSRHMPRYLDSKYKLPVPAATLREALGRAPTLSEVADALVDALRTRLCAAASPLSHETALDAELQAARARYGSPNWTWRR